MSEPLLVWCTVCAAPHATEDCPAVAGLAAERDALRRRLARYEDPDGSNVWEVAQHWMRVAVDDLAVIAYWQRRATRYQALWRARHDQVKALTGVQAEAEALADDLAAAQRNEARWFARYHAHRTAARLDRRLRGRRPFVQRSRL